MKILIFSQYFWPENFIINDLVSELKKYYHLEILTGKPNYPKGKFFKGYNFLNKSKDYYDGILINRVPIIPRYNSTKINLIINYFSFIFFSFFGLIFLNLKKKFNTCFLYAPSPLIGLVSIFLFKKFFNLKIYIWLQDLWPKVIDNKIQNKFLKKIIYYTCSYIYKNADIILTQNDYYKEYLFKELNINKEKIHTLFNWSPVEPAFNYTKKNEKDLKLIFTGNVGESQNLDNLINVAKSLSTNNVLIHIYGDGRYKNKLIKKIEVNNLKNIKVFPALDIKLLKQKMNEYDAALVLLAPEYFHTIPAKFQFYTSLAMPIIGAIEGEVNKIINTKSIGLCCGSNKPSDLKEIIIKFANMNFNQKKSMALNSFNYYRSNFSKEKNINFLREHFEK